MKRAPIFDISYPLVVSRSVDKHQAPHKPPCPNAQHPPSVGPKVVKGALCVFLTLPIVTYSGAALSLPLGGIMYLNKKLFRRYFICNTRLDH